MKCDQVRGLMGAYVYGDLSPDEIRVIKLHARECSECRQDLETQGTVVAAIDNTVPELTDIERQRVAWAVRGAVSKAPSREPVRLMWMPAFGVALLAGIALGMLANSVVSNRHVNQEAKTPAKPQVVVEVKEVPVNRLAKDNAKTAAGNLDPAAKQRDPDVVRMTEAVTKAVAGAIREGTSIAVASRKGHEVKRNSVTPREEPVVVQPEKEPSQAAPLKLPEPSSQNDARTTTDQNE